MKKIAINTFYTVHAAQLSWQEERFPTNLKLWFELSQINVQLADKNVLEGSFSSHLQLSVVSLVCHRRNCRSLSPVHCNSAHTSPVGSVGQSCLSTSCDHLLDQTGSKASSWSEAHARLCTLCYLSWSSWWQCCWLDVFWTNVQKLLNDWRTVGLAESQWGGEDLKLCVLHNFISCSVTPNDKAFGLIKQVCITCQT